MNISAFLENEYKNRNWDSTSERSREQINTIERLVGGENLLLIQSTGWGKTVVYALATKYLRQSGLGPTVIISPTLSLIDDQIETLKGFGLNCVTLNHTNKEQHERIYSEIKSNTIDVILVSAEKATDEYFLNRLGSPSLCVCDECHIISEVGHDFRPQYANLCKLINKINIDSRILATTATADTDVINDVIEQLGNLNIIRGNMNKSTHSINVVNFSIKEDCSNILKNAKINWLRMKIPYIYNTYGCGLIYCTKTKTVDILYQRLNEFNIRENWELRIGKYYSDDEKFPRARVLSALKQKEIDIMICTGPSLGIGIDFDFGFTIHFDPPMSILQLYQEIGRAGRSPKSTPKACSYIMYSPKSKTKTDKTMHSNVIDRNIATTIYTVLQNGEATTDELKKACCIEKNIKFNRTLNILISSNCIKKKSGLYSLSLCALEEVFKKDEEIVNRRINAFNNLVSCIISKNTCIMQQIRITLGDPTPNISPCGKCSVCTQNILSPN